LCSAILKDDVGFNTVMSIVYSSQSNGLEDDYSTQHYKDDHLVKKASTPMRISHLMAFNIKENNDQISGILSIELDYYQYDGNIKYRDIHYSNPRLIKHIEGNPRVMKNIDAYLRKNLLESEYGIKF
jgi:hypothetical protein